MNSDGNDGDPNVLASANSGLWRGQRRGSQAAKRPCVPAARLVASWPGAGQLGSSVKQAPVSTVRDSSGRRGASGEASRRDHVCGRQDHSHRRGSGGSCAPPRCGPDQQDPATSTPRFVSKHSRTAALGLKEIPHFSSTRRRFRSKSATIDATAE